MLALSIILFGLIRQAGETLAPAPADVEHVTPPIDTHPSSQFSVIQHVLTTLAVVILLGATLARICRVFGQPPVIGEVMAGILLGPSVLGAFAPELMHRLIPTPAQDPQEQVLASLRVISQLGVVLYMFLVGLELNAASLKHRFQAALGISHTSIVVPFILGSALSLWLYPHLSARGVPFTHFALFMGAAMAVTAFPVLARILADQGQDKSHLGVMALGCAAADDVTAWCLLAVVVGIAQSVLEQALLVTSLTIAYILLMLVFVRPLVARLVRRWENGSPSAAALSVIFGMVLLSALATEFIGIHAVFGGFLIGAVIPHDSSIAKALTHKFKDLVIVLFLPAFFALTGMRTSLALLTSWDQWLMCGSLIAVAVVGKVGGTYAAARLSGYDARAAMALGVMMNTRGLMGLIVLDIGYQMGIISDTLYAMMVLMALATTLMTAPLLKRLMPPDRREEPLPRTANAATPDAAAC